MKVTIYVQKGGSNDPTRFYYDLPVVPIKGDVLVINWHRYYVVERTFYLDKGTTEILITVGRIE